MLKETMSSLQIAEISGKRHKDVMRAIRKMEPAWEKICGRKFALTSQIVDMPNGGTRKESCYILNKTECLFIATKFNDEARAKLVLRWEELERKNHKNEISLPDFSNPAEAARAWANEYEAKQKALAENAIMKPKADFYDTVVSTESLLSMGDTAKLLDKNVGRNRLYKILREKKILMSDNIPYQQYVDRGYFKVVENYYMAGDNKVITKTTYVKQKGVDYIRKLLKEMENKQSA